MIYLDFQLKKTVLRSDIIKLKNAQMVMHKHELAYDDDIAHKFLHTAHNKTQRGRYGVYDGWNDLVHNPF